MPPCDKLKGCKIEQPKCCPNDGNLPCWESWNEAPKRPTPFGLLERFVKWLKVLFCRHDWEYGESCQYSMPVYRCCKKCGQEQKLYNDGGCHGETWWQNVAT